MTDREGIIAIARQRHAAPAEVRFVLGVATQTDDRSLLAVCLDCFRSVLRDSQEPVAFEAASFLGALLRDRACRRIRRRVLITAIYIGAACGSILPEIMAVYRKPGSLCAWKAARDAALCVSWSVLADGDAAQRTVALNTYEQLNSLGLLNLRAFIDGDACRDEVRLDVERLIARLEQRYPGN